jgi:hypothetical protein
MLKTSIENSKPFKVRKSEVNFNDENRNISGIIPHWL